MGIKYLSVMKDPETESIQNPKLKAKDRYVKMEYYYISAHQHQQMNM